MDCAKVDCDSIAPRIHKESATSKLALPLGDRVNSLIVRWGGDCPRIAHCAEQCDDNKFELLWQKSQEVEAVLTVLVSQCFDDRRWPRCGATQLINGLVRNLNVDVGADGLK